MRGEDRSPARADARRLPRSREAPTSFSSPRKERRDHGCVTTRARPPDWNVGGTTLRSGVTPPPSLVSWRCAVKNWNRVPTKERHAVVTSADGMSLSVYARPVRGLGGLVWLNACVHDLLLQEESPEWVLTHAPTGWGMIRVKSQAAALRAAYAFLRAAEFPEFRSSDPTVLQSSSRLVSVYGDACRASRDPKARQARVVQ